MHCLSLCVFTSHPILQHGLTQKKYNTTAQIMKPLVTQLFTFASKYELIKKQQMALLKLSLWVCSASSDFIFAMEFLELQH